MMGYGRVRRREKTRRWICDAEDAEGTVAAGRRALRDLVVTVRGVWCSACQMGQNARTSEDSGSGLCFGVAEDVPGGGS